MTGLAPRCTLFVCFMSVLPTTTRAADAITPGKLVVERPTLVCAGLRWYVAGDDNRNAAVTVHYPVKGTAEWKNAQPLLRVKGEWIARGEKSIEWTAPNLFAGSILDLTPATEYEVRLSLTDPDGGGTERTVTVKTRAEPVVPMDGRQLHVYPPGGRRHGRGFVGLRAAYAEARPGDVLLLHKGVYTVPEKEKRERTDYVLDKPGTADRPIVVRAAGDGEVVLDGQGAVKLIDCQKGHYTYLEGLTLRKADYLVYAGRGAACTGLVLRRCRLVDGGFGVFGLHPGCRDFYVADNEIVGRRPQWHPRVSREDNSQGVWLQGQGHVVCHNRVRAFWDGIDLFGGAPPADPALQNCAVDIYENEISECSDDGIEMDYGVHNIRVFRNFIHDVFMGISAQPIYGGPAYVVRNVVYNCTRAPIKTNQFPAGLLVYNNTFVAHGSAGRWTAQWQNSRIVNNLFVGTDGGPGVIWTGTPTPETSQLDYNGWYFFKSDLKFPIWWRFDRPVRVPTSSTPSAEGMFKDLSEFVRYVGYEKHGRTIDPTVFVRYQSPSGTVAPLPELDLRLRPDGAAVDAGLALDNITGGFSGRAPDLGAHELGVAQPHYGPRRAPALAPAH